jgi:hypothetical protein
LSDSTLVLFFFLFRVYCSISSGYICGNYDCWLIEHHQYISIFGRRTQLVFCNSFSTNFDSYEYKNNLTNKVIQLVSIEITTYCWRTCSLVYKKAKHILNVRFGVPVWAIRIVSHKVCILIPNHFKSIFHDLIFV